MSSKQLFLGCLIAVVPQIAALSRKLSPATTQASGTFQQLGKVTASDKTAWQFFGYSVSIHGDYAIVGAYGSTQGSLGFAGAAYVFKRSGTSWIEEAKLAASDKALGASFGTSVSINDNYAIVGAYGSTQGSLTKAGAAYVFKHNGTSWVEEAKLTASDKAANDGFGRSVSINGGYALVGAYKVLGRSAGAAYVFKRSEESWTEEAIITASDKAAGDYFGFSVGIHGNYAIVGAHTSTQGSLGFAGAAYVFKRTGTSWVEEAKLTASDKAAGDRFGRSVSIDGNYAVVGAFHSSPGGMDKAGAAYVFKRDGTAWAEEVALTASDKAPKALFGQSVSISGSHVLTGSRSSGVAAYMFERSGTSWIETKLIAKNTSASEFGHGDVSVSMDGESAVVGSWLADPEGLSRSGEAYFFLQETAPQGDLFVPVAEASDQVCRGATNTDNSDEYYKIISSQDLDHCKAACQAMPRDHCKGIEYSTGRCELWTRPEGIGSTRSLSGFTCLRYAPARVFLPVDGGRDRACRGDSARDNKFWYFDIAENASSLQDCQEACMLMPSCVGIEFGGRCELWTRVQGIQAAVYLKGSVCMKLKSVG